MMTMSRDQNTWDDIAQAIATGSHVLDVRKLTGGVSAELHALTLGLPNGSQQRVVVRRHGPRDLAANPNIANDEFRLLKTLHQVDIPVPQPILLDTSCRILPTPYLIQAYIEGAPDFAPEDLNHYLEQMAQQLARIHQVDRQAHDVSYLPHITPAHEDIFSQMPSTLDASINEHAIREVLMSAWPWEQVNADALLHGDYWPGNVLMRDGALIAVIDWEDARLGDPLYDLGNTRLELLWAYGEAAMQRFTAAYLAMQPQLDISNLPYWDLCAALRPAGRIDEWASNPEQAQHWRESLQRFVQQAMAALDR